MYLDEAQQELLSRRNVHVSIPTLYRSLRQLGISRKQVSRRAYERNDEKWATYMNHIADIAPDPEMLMFGDEAA
ncbi:hypothetical protein BJ138DRAFT_983661, partial [Hygrophoropsis aurantiaca]